MRLLMYVFCILKKTTFFIFPIFALATTPSPVLFCNFVKFQYQSFYIQVQRGIYMINSFSINLILIFVTIFYLYPFKMCFYFNILFTEITRLFY